MTARGLWHRFVGALTGTLFLSNKGGVYRLLGVAQEQTNAQFQNRCKKLAVARYWKDRKGSGSG